MEELEDKFVAGEWIPPFIQPSPTPAPKRKKQQANKKHKKREKRIKRVRTIC